MRRGTAKAYPEAVVASEVLADMVEFVASRDDVSDDTRRTLVEVAQNSSRIPNWLRSHLHGDARPNTTPDLLTISRMMSDQRNIVVQFNAAFGSTYGHAMARDDDTYVPIAVKMVTSMFEDLVEEYDLNRQAGREPCVAMIEAVVARLDIGEEELEEVVAFLLGQRDDVYGESSGVKLATMTLRHLEEQHRMLETLR